MSNLEDMSKEELVELAQERGIEGRSTMTKQALVDALREPAATRFEDERWVEVQVELAGLRREVELARLERLQAEAELRREQEEGWREKEEQLASLQAREQAVRLRARERARELRKQAGWEDDGADAFGDRIPGLDDDKMGLRQAACAATSETTRLVRSFAMAFADAAGAAADAVLPTGRPERKSRMRPSGRGRRDTAPSRSRPGGRMMMMRIPSKAYSGLMGVVDRSLDVPPRTVEGFYDAYYKK